MAFEGAAGGGLGLGKLPQFIERGNAIIERLYLVWIQVQGAFDMRHGGAGLAPRQEPFA